MNEEWQKAQEWEKEWWGDCLNTYGEEEKQLVYARRMGLRFTHNGKTPYNLDVMGRKIADFGGGVCSLICKSSNFSVGSVVIDPILENAPGWVTQRYIDNGIIPLGVKAEDFDQAQHEPMGFYESWIYNCLQHTDDPKQIIDNAKLCSKIVRIFEWIDTKVNVGHPHSLTEENLNSWLGGEGKVEVLNLPTLKGKCYYGVFKGDLYNEGD